MEDHYLLQSLLAAATTTTVPSASVDTATATITAKREPVDPNTTTNVNVSGIIFRVLLISFIGIIAIWANHEASRGFSITVVNDAAKHSLAAKHFSLFYESNDKATRIVLNTSRFVENLLYPNNDQDSLNPKNQINSVTLRLAPINIPTIVAVDSQEPHEYIISLSPSLLTEPSKNEESHVVLAVLQGMARVWLWDAGKGATPPPELLNGMVEYISILAGFSKPSGGATTSKNNEICWKDKDPRRVAGFLRYCDQSKQVAGGGGGGGSGGGGGGDGAVIRRLNQQMSNYNNWDDGMMDDVLGMGGHHACASYYMMIKQLHPSSSM